MRQRADSAPIPALARDGGVRDDGLRELVESPQPGSHHRAARAGGREPVNKIRGEMLMMHYGSRLPAPSGQRSPVGWSPVFATIRYHQCPEHLIPPLRSDS